MNFIEFESAQKLRGGFYTEQSIASFLVRWIRQINPKRVLEPSCGDGAFLEALSEAKIRALKLVDAFEIDEAEATKAQGRTSLNVNVTNSDFLRWYLFHGQNGERYDAVIGNPPFIRYQYLPSEQQSLAEKIFKQLHLPFTKHTNAWVPFVLASLKLLRPGGRMAMVIPSELLHIPHAQSLRRYLAQECSKILLLDPDEIWFGETLQGTVLLLAEKKHESTERGEGVGVVAVRDRGILSSDPEEHFSGTSYSNGATIEGKWMPVFLSEEERSLLASLKSHKLVRKFDDIATVDVGIVTGANKFFLVPDDTVRQHSLQRWAHPMFGRSNHVKGLIYKPEDHASNKSSGLPANFLWFDDYPDEKIPESLRKYLDIGLEQKLHRRFKCRTRKTWYRVPSVYLAPVAMLKRAHHYPRLVLNKADAYTTDTAYRIRTKSVTPESLVFSFVNSLTSLSAEMEGRHYGGGVLELVPSEIERLLIPTVSARHSTLAAADKRYRSCASDSDFLQSQDRTILSKLGLSDSEQQSIHGAWLKLRDRRHRTPAE